MTYQKRLHIVVGGIDNGDKAALDRLGPRSGRVSQWNVPREAIPGDDVVFFIPGFGFYATGVIDGNPVPRKGWKNRYKSPVRGIRLIDPPISLSVILAEVPELSWARYPRSITSPDTAVSEAVRELIQRRRSGKLSEKVPPSLDGLNLLELRRLALSKSSKIAKVVSRSQKQRLRSEAIKLYALRRADGVCEGCGTDAPFRTSSGSAFLEVHHAMRLSDEGPDAPGNVIALCPNCHRRAHHSEDREAFNNRLRAKIKRLEIRSGF